MEFIAFTFIEDSILLRLFLVLFILLVTYAVIIYLIDTLFINRYPFVNINTDKVEASDLFYQLVWLEIKPLNYLIVKHFIRI